MNRRPETHLLIRLAALVAADAGFEELDPDGPPR
jgi:hypothetical protein